MIITARREDRLQVLHDEIQSNGGEIHFVAGDITDADLHKRVLDTAQREFGGLDLLVNNAGTTAIGMFSENEPQWLRHIMEVNFFAPVELTRLALPMLRDGVRPIVVNVTSVLAHRAVPRKTEYCASKFALHGFSDALRAELSQEGIDLLMVSPSTTKTEIFDVAPGDKSELRWLAKGGSTPEKVARKAAHAIRRGKHEIILTVGGKMLVWIDRLCPPLANRLLARFG